MAKCFMLFMHSKKIRNQVNTLTYMGLWEFLIGDKVKDTAKTFHDDIESVVVQRRIER